MIIKCADSGIMVLYHYDSTTFTMVDRCAKLFAIGAYVREVDGEATTSSLFAVPSECGGTDGGSINGTDGMDCS